MPYITYGLSIGSFLARLTIDITVFEEKTPNDHLVHVLVR